MRPLIKRFRESAIPILLLAFVALGWIVALKAHDDQAKDEQYQQQGANDSGGEDAWLSSLTR
jgi:hypothetical protein